MDISYSPGHAINLKFTEEEIIVLQHAEHVGFYFADGLLHIDSDSLLNRRKLINRRGTRDYVQVAPIPLGIQDLGLIHKQTIKAEHKAPGKLSYRLPTNTLTVGAPQTTRHSKRTPDTRHIQRLLDAGISTDSIEEAWGTSHGTVKGWMGHGDAPFWTLCAAEALQRRRGRNASLTYFVRVPAGNAPLIVKLLKTMSCIVTHIEEQSS